MLVALSTSQWCVRRAKGKLKRDANRRLALPQIRAASEPPPVIMPIQPTEQLKRVARDAYREFTANSTPPQCASRIHYPRFVSQVRTMGNNRSFLNHKEFCDYRVMATHKGLQVHSTPNMCFLLSCYCHQGQSVGFGQFAHPAYQPPKQVPRNRHKEMQNGPQRDLRSVRKAFLLSTQERFLVRLPKINH